MGWYSVNLNRIKTLGCAVLALGAVLTARPASAQFPGTANPPAAADLYSVVSNAYLSLEVGVGTNVAGSIGLITTATNPLDSGGGIFGNLLLWPAPLKIQAVAGVAPYYFGTWLFVRTDGGNGGTLAAATGNITTRQGGDYIWGDQATGTWTTPPTVIGSHIVAAWQTKAAVTGVTGGGSNATYDPQIEIRMTGTFVHDTVRFQFDVVNHSAGQTHSVGLVFVQDINIQPSASSLGEVDGPLRVPTGPYLRHEVLLSGSDVPSRWESFVQVSPATAIAPAKIHSVRGTLAPTNSAQSEPTPPSSFAYGRTRVLNGTDTVNATANRNFDVVWGFKPDPLVSFDRLGTANTTDASVALYWNPQDIAANQTRTYVTYVGQGDSENDFGAPISLSVTGPSALTLSTDKTDPLNPKTVIGPSPFTVTAYVQNLTDLTQSGGIAIGPVNLFIDLPPGLRLYRDATTQQSAQQQIASVSPGSENSVSWLVEPDPTTPASGTLRYTVTASPSIGNGKSVQKSIELPGPPTFVLKNSTTTQGQFQMFSFPVVANNAPPTAVLGVTNAQTPLIDIVRWNPLLAHYEPVNTLTPGLAYWVRSHLSTDVTLTIDTQKYPPLESQTQPNAATYKVTYPQGWNQIGDPYLYGFRLSEVQIFDPASLTLNNIVDAADSLHNWILPAVYQYNTSDINPANWHYDLYQTLGVQIQPFQGYWIYVRKANLQFIFPGADTPGGQVTRAAQIGASTGIQSGRSAINRWQLAITARGESSMDTAYIGVAPGATEGADNFKFNKPPSTDSTVTIGITHGDWGRASGAYAYDMRSADTTRKSWPITITSVKPNENVTLSWNNFSSVVPRSYRLKLVDHDTGTQRDLRSTASLSINTGSTATRSLELIAEPARTGGAAVITGVNVITSAHRIAGQPASVTIQYNLTQPVDAQVVIRDASGATLRTLNPSTSTRATTDGATTLGQAVWDLRDRRGMSLSAGSYTVEVSALSADGQRSRVTRPFLIAR